MRTEWRVFSVVAAFLLVISGVYAWWTDYTLKEIDWAGTTALLLSSGLCGMMAGFFWFVARRIELRPEDRGDAEIAEGAGEVGFFSPGSYWPVAIAASATLTAIGVSFWQLWLIALGLLLVAITVAGMLFEYYTGTRRTAEH
ncbi:MAG: cytochrome C oxidase subunit IV [Actinobacteria bacterium]|nr:MAG: cytochrome C oxidase subunit IV [Actinomycetota bacterium]